MSVTSSAKLFNLTTLDGVTLEQLKHIYHELAGKYHPDKGGSAKEFIELRNAYTSLKEAIRLGIQIDEEPVKQATGNTDRTNSHTHHTQQQSPEDNLQDYYTLHQQYQNLQKHFADLQTTNRKYDHTFNIQIALINNTVNSINTLASTYNTNFKNAKSVLDQGLEILLQQRNRKWWEHIIPVPKLSESEYIQRHNELIESYNSQITEFQEEYNNLLINTYQKAFEQMISKIKEL